MKKLILSIVILLAMTAAVLGQGLSYRAAIASDYKWRMLVGVDLKEIRPRLTVETVAGTEFDFVTVSHGFGLKWNLPPQADIDNLNLGAGFFTRVDGAEPYTKWRFYFALGITLEEFIRGEILYLYDQRTGHVETLMIWIPEGVRNSAL